MNTRIIGYQIKQKVNSWLKSIKDEELREYLGDKVVVTGGCIASMLLNEPVNDYDIYLTTKEAVLRTSQYYVKTFKDAHPNLTREIIVVDGDDLEFEGQYQQYGVGPGRVAVVVKSDGVAGDDRDTTDPENVLPAEGTPEPVTTADADARKKAVKEFKPVYLTSNAITLSDKVQIVIRFYGTPEDVHKNFDFVHVLSYWESRDHGHLHLNPRALECLLTKELRYVGSRYPICSVIRIRKFLKRGFTIGAGEILKICFQINELNLKDVSVLADQLVGVDTTYFSQLIAAMRAEKEKDKEFLMSYSYLIKVIDRIFDDEPA